MSKSQIRIPGGRRTFFFLGFSDSKLQGRGSNFFLYSCCWDMKLYQGSFGFSEESLKFSIFFQPFSFLRSEGFDLLSSTESLSHLRNCWEKITIPCLPDL